MILVIVVSVVVSALTTCIVSVVLSWLRPGVQPTPDDSWPVARTEPPQTPQPESPTDAREASALEIARLLRLAEDLDACVLDFTKKGRAIDAMLAEGRSIAFRARVRELRRQIGDDIP
jgi:hypothetical protein